MASIASFWFHSLSTLLVTIALAVFGWGLYRVLFKINNKGRPLLKTEPKKSGMDDAALQIADNLGSVSLDVAHLWRAQAASDANEPTPFARDSQTLLSEVVSTNPQSVRSLLRPSENIPTDAISVLTVRDENDLAFIAPVLKEAQTAESATGHRRGVIILNLGGFVQYSGNADALGARIQAAVDNSGDGHEALILNHERSFSERRETHDVVDADRLVGAAEEQAHVSSNQRWTELLQHTQNEQWRYLLTGIDVEFKGLSDAVIVILRATAFLGTQIHVSDYIKLQEQTDELVAEAA